MLWPGIIALLVLVVAVVLVVAQGFTWPLVLIAALGVAILTARPT